jgi:hypothetical protein
MPDEKDGYPDPREEDIYAGDRRISRPDSSLPDWYVSDASYRPIPIAWFAAAIIMQAVAIFLIALFLLERSVWLMIGLSGLTTGLIGMWTWERGIKNAKKGWKVGLAMVLGLQLAIACLGAATQI